VSLPLTLAAAIAGAIVLGAGFPPGYQRSLAAALLVQEWVVPAALAQATALLLLWSHRRGAAVGISAAAGTLGLVLGAWAAVDARGDVGYAGPAGLVVSAAVALLHGALALAAFSTLRPSPRPGVRSVLAGASLALLIVFAAFLAAPVVHGLDGGAHARVTGNSRSAVANARVLAICAEEARRASPDGSYPRTAAELAATCTGPNEALEREEAGYVFAYAATARTGERATGFVITARPLRYGRTGRVSVLVDESAAVRTTDEDRPATTADRVDER
jgi:hypothetical protein